MQITEIPAGKPSGNYIKWYLVMIKLQGTAVKITKD